MSCNILSGIRVVDLARYIAGPFCGMLLADMGAEVIKVEKPKVGEVTRRSAPWKDGVSLSFPAYNLNKKSISLDVRTPEGMEILRDLIAHSDVLLENFRVGTVEKMGLSYEEVKRIDPSIIMVSVSGFGQVGPYRNHLAFDGVISAMAGITRFENGRAERSKGALQDHMAALYATVATLLAVIDREKTGKGQYIDVAMFASSAMVRNESLADAYVNGGDICIDDAAPFGFLYASDGCVYFHAGLGNMYDRLMAIVDDPFLHEERFHDPAIRTEHADELIAHLQEWAKDMSAKELDGLLTANDITSAVISSPKELIHDVHLKEAGFLKMIPIQGLSGSAPYIGLPFKMSEHPDVEFKPAPDVGENNDEIYSHVLGFSDEKISELKNNGII